MAVEGKLLNIDFRKKLPPVFMESHAKRLFGWLNHLILRIGDNGSKIRKELTRAWEN